MIAELIRSVVLPKNTLLSKSSKLVNRLDNSLICTKTEPEGGVFYVVHN